MGWGDFSSGGKKLLPKKWGTTYCKDFLIVWLKVKV